MRERGVRERGGGREGEREGERWNKGKGKGGDRQGREGGKERDSTGFIRTFSIAVVFGVCLMF